MTDTSSSIIPLWIERVFENDDHWDRLRVVGTAENLGEGIAQITFHPIRQRIPAFSVKTRPEMAESSTAQILAEYNTLANLCEVFASQRADISRVEPADLGNKVKFLLRMSNFSNQHLFTEINEVPSALSELGQKPTLLFQGIPILDIHAFEERILIAGGPIGHAKYWPEGSAVREVNFARQGFDYNGPVGENIIVSTTIPDDDLGKLVIAVWKAKISVLVF